MLRIPFYPCIVVGILMKNDSKGLKLSALIVSSMAAFLVPFMGSAVNVALPVIGEDFDIDAVMLGWVSISYILAAAIFFIPAGRLADIYGRKKVFIIGIVIYTVSSLLSGIAPNGWSLIGFRAIEGVGSAIIFSTGVAILTSVYPPSERGKVLGINVASVYVGLTAGPFLGGILTEFLGWRSIFLINVPLGAFIIGLVIWKLKGEWAEARGERFDIVGTIVYGLHLTLLIYGLSELPNPLGAVLAALAVVGLATFILWEKRVKSPLLDVNLFIRNRVFGFSSLAALIHYSATFAVAFYLSLYLQSVRGHSSFFAGLVLVSQPVIMALVSPVSGRVSDRVEPRVVASIGMGLSALALLLLFIVNEDTRLAFIITALVILGVGFALFSSPNTNAIMSSVKRKYLGVASGTVGTARQMGMMFSMSISIVFLAVFLGREKITEATTGDFIMAQRGAFLVFGVLCVLGVLASLVRGRLRE
jgi:EmrB/QacA subfamily drug resistance transporter